MNKQIIFNKEIHDKLLKGVNTLGDAVKSTLGPKGRNVIIQNAFGGTPTITKDGVSVAKEINLSDNVENLAAQILKQAAKKTVEACGDGTTTATVLAQTLYNEGIKYIRLGLISPIELKRELERLTPQVLQYIKDQSIIIENKEQLKQVATVSANNDITLGNLIAEAFENAGKEGLVLAEESKSISTYTAVTEGAQFDRGYISPHFINNKDNLTVEFNNPYILFYDKKIRAAQDLVPVLGMAVRDNNRPLLVIAEEIETSALSVLLINKVNMGYQFAAVKTPAFGERRGKMLEDLAILTGGKVITEVAGKTLAQVTKEDLGTASKIIITRTSTTILHNEMPEHIQKAVENRIEEIKAEISQSESSYEILKAQERIAMLSGKISMIYIGAATEVELKEKKDRLDDAVQATQAALKAGIVPGGGTVYVNAANTLLEETIPTKVLKTALQAPFRGICENADVSPDLILPTISKTMGYNAHTGEITDLMKSGVVDPTQVLLSALENAVSVANMLFLANTAIILDPSIEAMPEMPDMSNMYNV